MRAKHWWTLYGTSFLVFAWVFNRDAWDGWSWPTDVTLAQAGAEIEAAVFLVGSLVCLGVATVLHEFDARFGRRSP